MWNLINWISPLGQIPACQPAELFVRRGCLFKKQRVPPKANPSHSSSSVHIFAHLLTVLIPLGVRNDEPYTLQISALVQDFGSAQVKKAPKNLDSTKNISLFFIIGLDLSSFWLSGAPLAHLPF